MPVQGDVGYDTTSTYKYYSAQRHPPPPPPPLNMKIPTDYENSGCARARAMEPEIAENYLAHAWIGDPLADAAVEALSSMRRSQSTQILTAYIDSDEDKKLPDTPPEVYALFQHAWTPPDWLKLPDLNPGSRMFLQNLKPVLGAMIAGTLVEGFSTNISKSFFITGRLRESGVRRLQQNNRHMVEIFFPGGLERYGDGWKLSVRIRLIHAQIRRLLNSAEDWDTDAWGLPLSSAHLGYAMTAFSARLLTHMKTLGATYTDDEAASFMAVWRYSGYLMGVPESILYRDEAEARKLFRIGTLCEPTPGASSVVMAHSLINSAPFVVGVDSRDEALKLSNYVFKVSQTLIGNELAHQLKYPNQTTIGALPWLRFQARYDHIISKYFPKRAGKSQFNNFMTLLSGSRFDDGGITYDMPDHVYAEESRQW